MKKNPADVEFHATDRYAAHRCGTCSMFEPLHGCAAVDVRTQPWTVCNLWRPAPPIPSKARPMSNYAHYRVQQLGGYSGPADCTLADATTLRLNVQLHAQTDGDGMVGSLTLQGDVARLFHGGDPVTLRLINTLPAGMERKFVVSGVVQTSRFDFAQVYSVGGWF